jgi:hypothetical protein
VISDELWALALALPPAERAELAHALMDSLYEAVDWDDEGSFREQPAPEESGVPPVVADVIDIGLRRAPPRRA